MYRKRIVINLPKELYDTLETVADWKRRKGEKTTIQDLIISILKEHFKALRGDQNAAR